MINRRAFVYSVGPTGDTMKRPDIFDFDDHREFLTRWFAWRRADREARGLSTYTHRMFAAEAGISNVGILLSVIKGDRHLTKELQQCFRKAMDLNDAEAEHLGRLAERAELNRKRAKAKTKAESSQKALLIDPSKRARRHAEISISAWRESEEQLNRLNAAIASQKRMHRKAVIPAERYGILSSWSTAAILELARCAAFRWDAAWIAQTLGGGLGVEEVAEALETLEAIGLLRRDSEADDVPLVTPDEVPAQYVRRFYEGLYHRSGEALRMQFETPGFADWTRMGALTIAVPAAAVPALRELVLNTRRQLFAALEGLEGPPEVLYQVWLHVFPVTEVLPSG